MANQSYVRFDDNDDDNDDGIIKYRYVQSHVSEDKWVIWLRIVNFFALKIMM